MRNIMGYKIEEIPTMGILTQIMHRSMQLSKESFHSIDLKPGQVGILFILRGNGEISQKQLAEKAGVTPPSITVALRKLEQEAYVERIPDQKDQRVMRLRLSVKGEQCIEKIEERVRMIEEKIFKGFSQEEKMLFRRLLIQMRENLGEGKGHGMSEMLCVSDEMKREENKGRKDVQ